MEEPKRKYVPPSITVSKIENNDVNAAGIVTSAPLDGVSTPLKTEESTVSVSNDEMKSHNK